ncbi:SMI1/KNR4 family protein [Deinococcus sp. SL84]|uniref:SMI1/KNR4 family protein n=1 Tax=Deinococcus sp. SL84 TaxID=2994663 RepID=UPI0022730B2D|nr:SMI1/KNR4 family protein [Deinococcus sp. SL84]MCY1702218.1 SMI1/KNR4 family protein [Deinococcus sp. SL84]
MEYLGVTFIPLDETKLTPQELADFEAHYGQRIPDTLRELFQQTNNALVENCVLDIPALEGGVMPEGWAGVGEYGMTYRIESAGSFLPPGMLPFADDPGGSLSAVKMDGQREAGVFFFDHEEVDEDGYFVSYRVADTVAELLEMMRQALE